MLCPSAPEVPVVPSIGNNAGCAGFNETGFRMFVKVPPHLNYIIVYPLSMGHHLCVSVLSLHGCTSGVNHSHLDIQGWVKRNHTINNVCLYRLTLP